MKFIYTQCFESWIYSRPQVICHQNYSHSVMANLMSLASEFRKFTKVCNEDRKSNFNRKFRANGYNRLMFIAIDTFSEIQHYHCILPSLAHHIWCQTQLQDHRAFGRTIIHLKDHLDKVAFLQYVMAFSLNGEMIMELKLSIPM